MKNKNVLELLSEAAEKQATRTAIEQGGKRITYAQLANRSAAIANCLLANGAKRGTIVGLLVEDTSELITAIVGVLKAGCAFMPLDLDYPAKRLAAMVEAVKPDWFIVEASLLERASLLAGAAGHHFLCLDGTGDFTSLPSHFVHLDQYLNDGNLSEPAIELAPNDMCYIYFTSGSTGKPKPIAGCVKGFSHFIRWEIQTFHIDDTYRISQLIPPAFDPFLRDVFAPLCAGGTLCIPAERELILNPIALIDWLEHERITLIHCVPTLFRTLVNERLNPTGFQNLKYILLAGEQLFPAEVKKWMSIYGERVQLVNLYGPTETTLAKFCYLITLADQDRHLIPVGKPIEGAKAIILDDHLSVCPPGIVGEIYIRTPFRTLGYYNQPELAKEVFIQNPFSHDPNDIIYKTGDIGRILEDGNFELLGRRDQQVKVKGVRIELEEIEKLLRDHPQIQDVAVKDWEDVSNERFLCVYVVSDEEPRIDELRGYLSQYLPPVMIPSVFIRLDEMPLNLNGKLDRRALPDPREKIRSGVEYVAPRNDIERKLVEIWQRVLRYEKEIGVNDNFFVLGGHSLMATQVISQINLLYDVEVKLRTLFDQPTIANLATAIVQEQAAQADVETLIQMVDELKHLSEADVQKLLEAERQASLEKVENA